ncbi:type VI secretion system protein TssR domain-containing protein [Flavobacterium artemisiae]|uniref:Type VI secretion system protein TssR domain-containing protein n=1 Tax=Flavobacterium artemisiae TaxID=2126556 RepID=A0ABW4HG49_9FLAO
MKINALKSYIFLTCLVITNAITAQVKNSTTIVTKTEKNVNTYDNEAQKEEEKSELKLVFSDRNDNNIYEGPFGSKVKSKVKILLPMYVIDENKNYYEVVVADKKLIGKPKGTLSILRNKKNHFANAKEVQYLGWIKKDNLIEYSRAVQNQSNLKYVKYFVACNTLDNLFSSAVNVKKNVLPLKNDPNLELASKKNVKLNDFVYVYKINHTTNAAFVSNFDDIMAKDTVNLKYGWVPLQYLNPIEDDWVVRLNSTDKLEFSSGKIIFKANELYKNTFFINENQTNKPIKFDSPIKIMLPINIWNHEKNKITNLKGDDISINTIEKIATQSKTINFYYIFENNNSTRQHLKKTLSTLQNLKLTISNDQYANYNFTYSFIAKGRPRSYYLIKSKSFSEWFELIEKSVKYPDEITQENVLPNNDSNISQFLSPEASFENNFFILAGVNSSINSVLPDNFRKMAENNSRLLFIIFGNENTTDSQDFILQSKMYLNEASNANKKNIQNYFVDPKLIVKNDEFTYNGEYDNAFIYDAPLRSNFNGGIIFPKLNAELTPETINKAIDSVIIKTIKTNNGLLKSLTQYKNEFSFLRSQPSQKINDLISTDPDEDKTNKNIPKNYVNETYVIKTRDSLKGILEDKINILLTENEIRQLLENYRELINKDYTKENINRIDVANFKEQCNFFVENIKKTEAIKSRSSLAELLYFKTRVFVNNSYLHEIRIKDIRKFKRMPEEFKSIFVFLNSKLEVLEKMQRNNAFEVFNEEAEIKYYYIPKKLLL